MDDEDRRALNDQRRGRVQAYFRYVDDGDPRLLTLFTDDIELWFPKFGTGRGPAALGRFAERLALASIAHDIDAFRYLISGDTIVVEGTERGVTKDGITWPDGEISQGRFCGVFDFRGLLISRLSIYVDPDFTSEHASRIAQLRGHSRT